MSRQHLRKNLVRAGVALLALLVLYAGAGFLLAPWLFQRHLPQYLEQKLEREVSVGNVRVNPFLLNMELSEVVIEGRHGPPVIAADRLFVDLGFRGLFSLTWMVDQLTVEGLRAHLVLEPDGTLNMLEMARRLSRDDPAAKQGPPPLTVAEVSVSAASLVFTDLTGAQPASVTLEPLSLRATGLSTLADARGTHQLTTTLPDGGALEWRGELSLEPVLLASGQFQVRGLTAATVWPFVRDELLLSELQASANLSGRYAYDARASLQLEGVVVELADVLLARPGAPEPMLAMQQIAATGGSFDLAKRAGSLATLVLQSGHAVVAVAPDGSVNWASLVAPAQRTAESAAAPAAEPAAETAAAPTTAAPAAEGRTERSAGSRAPTTAGEQNTAAPSGLAAATAPASPGWELDIGNLQLDQVALRYVDRARQQPLAVSIGQLGGQAQLSIAGGSVTQAVASGVDAGLQQISLAAEGARDALVTLASAQVQQGRFDLLGKRLAAQQLSIEGGQARVVRQQDGDIAVLDLLGVGQAKAGSSSGSNGPPANKDATAWRYDIAELRVESIDVALQDRSFTPDVAYSLQLQSLTASNVASASEAPTPFNATVNVQQGGTLQTSGTLTPEGGVQARIKVDQLALAPLRPVARRYTGLAVNSGPLSVSGSVRYAPTRQGRPNLTLNDVALTLPKVVVRRPGREQPLLALQRIDASGGRLDLASRDIVVARLALRDGQVRAATQAGGGLDWTAAKRGRGKRASPAPPPAAAAWNIQLNALRFDSVGAHYADRSRPAPLVVDVDSVSGSVKLAVAAGGARTQVVAQGLDAKLQQVAVSAGERAQPAVALASGSIAQGHLNLVEQTVGAQEIVLAGGGTKLVRTADGKIPLLSLFTSEKSAPAQSQPAAADDWRYAVGALRVDAFGITYADRGFDPPLSIDGTLQASVKDLARDKRSSFDATLALDPGGTIKATGTVAAGAKRVQGQVEANQVALTPLQPLLQRFAALTLESGALSASAQARYEGGEADAMQADGTVRITDLVMNEAWSGDRFLAWKQLDADRVAFDLEARQLNVKEVTVRDPRAKIVISKDRSVNIAQVVKRDDKARAGAAADQAAAQDAPDFEFSVGRVRLLEGEVDYADLSLVLPFSTKVTALNGTIVGISSDPSRRADVEADGTIEPYGSAKVEGSIAMRDPRHFTDLHVEFNNVLVPPLSPYTATFAGRKVESGKLWLDLNYKVQDGELLGKNEIRLADFTLGEKVEAPNAMDLPLNLVVALLTDSKGVIHFSVPVRGDLDNPRFSVASAVRQAVGNMLRRIVSAPFRALGRLFGRSTDSLASIDFQPGSAKLAPQEREKLDALVRALSERPRLQLVVNAPYDPQRDASVLQRELARRQLAQALGRNIPQGEDPGPIAYDDPATRRALEQLLQQAGGEALAELRAEFGGPANGVGRAFYQAVFERLASNQALRDSATQVLATERARAIVRYLQQQGVRPERVQTGRLAPVGAEDGPVSAQLQVAADDDSPG